MFSKVHSVIKQHLPFFCIALVCLLFLYAVPKDPDFGWHYKYGEHIVNTHTLLRENTYSYTNEHYEWANSYWISQVILYLLFNIDGGIVMGLVLGIIFFIVGYLTLSSLSKNKNLIYITLILLSIVMHFYIITVRPMFFSSIFLFCLVYLLIKKRFIAYLLPLLFLLWANMHADFVLGLGIVAFYIFYKLVIDRKLDKDVILAFFLSILITVINPYGLLLHKTLIQEGNYMQVLHVLEFAPPTQSVWYAALISIFVPSFFAGVSLYFCPKKYMWLIIIHMLFLALGMISVYFLRLATILGTFSFVVCLGSISFPSTSRLWFQKLKLRLTSLTPFFALILVINLVSLMRDSHSAWLTSDNFPHGAVSYIQEYSLEGNIFNEFSWGGYLIWKLPEKQTFIDGRMVSWEDASGKLFSEYIYIHNFPTEGYPLLEKYMNQYDIRYVLFPKDAKLTRFLLEEKDFIVLYEDETAVVLQRPSQAF